MEKKKFWVYISHANDAADAMSLSLLSRAQVLAEENGMELQAIVAGDGCQKAAENLANMGVPLVYYADIKGLSQYEYLRIADIIYPLVNEKTPEIFLFPATDSASITASVLGQRLGTGVNVHCVTAEMRDGIFIGSVPAFGGQVMSEILCPVKKPQMATVRLSGGEFRKGIAGHMLSFADNAPYTEGLELISAVPEESTGISLTDAQLVLCGGAGLGDCEGWELMTKLAEKMGAAVCCTRDALDMDLGATANVMVGVSGCTITPKVYLGFGVSGAAHHLFGMKDSGLVLNVNIDKENAFFPASDSGYVGDAKTVLNAFLKSLN